ncbi:MAG TPA: pyridoxamine 5'-phosphate oxidase family protein [Candidatus Nanoarchaeia archaeon]|nr:pyridoxamine 5'-phosphate oxidase family protein [Candidatus Nanoarchaeia archaeon]
MHKLRRTDKGIADPTEIKAILHEAKFVTLALSIDDEPYLATLSHGFDELKNCIYFHCAKEGRKVDIMRANPRVWGQALVDGGYQQGRCDHLYKTAQFHGKVTFIDSASERKHALEVMIRHLDNNPETIVSKQVTEHSLNRVLIGRIDIDFLSGKKADKVIVQL